MARNLIFLSAIIMSFVLGPVGRGQVWADSLTPMQDTTNPKTATNLIGIAVTGADMVGMEVTVFFANMTNQMGTWSAIGATSGGIQQLGWSLIQAGDTFENTPWTLTNNSSVGIVGFSIEAISGNTVFDIVDDPKVTEVSGFGSLLTLLSPDAGLEVKATFSQPVGLAGGTLCSDTTTQAFCGDLFGTLNIEFLNGGQVASVQQFAFSVDTDRFEFPLPPSTVNPGVPGSGGPGSMTPSGGAPIPEPNSLLLLGTGVVGLLFAKKLWSKSHSSV